MDSVALITVFLTVVTGFLTFVLGQMALKLMIEPVQELRRTIGLIAHAMVERADFIHNPGVPPVDDIKDVSRELRGLSAKLQSHLYAIPKYRFTARLFRLPLKEQVLEASSCLIGLSNSLFTTKNERIYEINTKRVERVCDSLGIFMQEGNRWPKDL